METIEQKLRLDRLSISEKDSLVIFVFLKNKKYLVSDISDSGVSFLSEDLILEKKKEYEIELKTNEQKTLYKGLSKVMWISKKDKGQHIGLMFTSYQLKEQFIKSLFDIDKLKKEIATIVNDQSSLNEEYKALVFEFRSFLNSLKNRTDQIEKKINIFSSEIKKSYFECIDNLLEPYVISVLLEFSKRLDRIVTENMSRKEKKKAIVFFQNEVGYFFHSSSFLGRAKEKPLGYAGDYEMMNQIYRDEYEGLSLFDKLIHKYGINEFQSKSVRYRKEYFINKLNEVTKSGEKILIGSLACGPAREIVEFLQQKDLNKMNIEIILMDQDEEALLNAQRNIRSIYVKRGLECKIKYLDISVNDFLFETEKLDLLDINKFDFLYTAGLYDYLSRPIARALTIQLLDLVKEKGQLIIGNFHVNNPTKTMSEFTVDWRCIHRTEKDMFDLIPENIAESKNIHFDDQNINMFLEVEKK